MRKYILFLAVMVIISFLLSACSNKKGNTGITHFAYQETENGNWGIISVDGEVVVPPMFHDMPTPVTDGMFFVPTQDNMYELHNIKTPEKVIGSGYAKISSFSEGRAFVVQNGSNIVCIDKNGDVLYELPNDITTALPFCYGRALIGKMDENIAAPVYGFIDKEGEIVIPCDFSMATSFSGRYAVAVKQNAQYLSILDRNGIIVDNINGDTEDETLNVIANTLSIWGRIEIETDIVPYVVNSNFGLKKIKGNIILPPSPKYKIISFSNRGYCVYQTENGYGIMKETGEEIVADKFSYIGACNENGSGCFVASINDNASITDKWGIFSMNEKTLCEPIYDLILGIVNSNNFIAVKNGDYFLIKKNGKILKHFYSINIDPVSICLL